MEFLEYKRNIIRLTATLVLIFTLFPLVGNMKNAEKVGFFTKAEKLVIYQLDIKKAGSKADSELKPYILFQTEKINEVFKNVTQEEAEINTEGCYYARLHHRDGSTEDLIFADYGKAFVRLKEKGRIYRYGLVNMENLFEEREE